AVDEPDRRLTSMRAAGIACIAGALFAGGAVLAAIGPIDRPASVAEPADRVRPPTPHIADCPVFPGDNAWNQPVSALPLHPRSDEIIAQIQSSDDTLLHPDFGENPEYGIPYVVVPPDQPVV